MLLSDGMVHFLKMEKMLTNLPKLSCGFNVGICIDNLNVSLLYSPGLLDNVYSPWNCVEVHPKTAP